MQTVLRLPAWVESPFDELLLDEVNVAEVQDESDRDVAVRSPGTRVTWVARSVREGLGPTDARFAGEPQRARLRL